MSIMPAPTPPPATGKTVLVVDDEPDLVEMVTHHLRRAGHRTLSAGNGLDGLELARKHRPDLVVLDLMLPGIDGQEVARRLKADPATARVPILMLTAKGEESDIVVGLKLGADDYVTKPFSVGVLLARVGAVLRRAEPPPPADEGRGRLTAGPLTVDRDRHEVSVAGRTVKLTLTEFKLLAALAEARGRVLDRDRLMDKAMGEDVFVTDRAIDVHVTAIRRKLGDHAWLVHTVRGVGYRFQEEPPEA